MRDNDLTMFQVCLCADTKRKFAAKMYGVFQLSQRLFCCESDLQWQCPKRAPGRNGPQVETASRIKSVNYC